MYPFPVWIRPLMLYDLSDLGSLVLIRIIPLGRTLGMWTSYKERFHDRIFFCLRQTTMRQQC